MMQPFQCEICDSDGCVIFVGRVSDVSGASFLGEAVQDDIPQRIRNVLQAYHVAAECLAFRECGNLLIQLLTFRLQVRGIPGKDSALPLEDFQLGPDGLFSLDVEGVGDLQDKLA
jgi:hypothetical protein